LPVAEPPIALELADVPEETTQPEYVYLSLVDVLVVVNPKANMPLVEFPVAVPQEFDAVADVAEETVHPA
jgi:hypothetical protein